jgi:hypothetical protein
MPRTQGSGNTVSGGGGGVFGTEYQYIEDLNATSTNSDQYIQVLRLTTSSIPTGDYRLGWSFLWTNENNNSDTFVRVQSDDGFVVWEMDARPESPSGIMRFPGSGFARVSYTSGVHFIDIDLKASAVNRTAIIDQVRIELWRVS